MSHATLDTGQHCHTNIIEPKGLQDLYEFFRTETSGFPQFMAKMAELAELPFDWDLEGGLPPSEGSMHTAIGFTFMAAYEVRRDGIRWLNPCPAPSPDGGVILTWRYANRTLTVIFDAMNLEKVTILAKTAGQPSVRSSLLLPEAIQRVKFTLSPK